MADGTDLSEVTEFIVLKSHPESITKPFENKDESSKNKDESSKNKDESSIDKSESSKDKDEPFEITNDSSSVNSTPPKKRKSNRRQQKYRKAWEFHRELRDWLVADESNEYKAKCKVCRKALVADLTVLQSHAQANKHLRNSQTAKDNNQTIENLKAKGSGKPSEPPSRDLFKRSAAVEKSEEADDLGLETLSISDQAEGGYQVEGSYSGDHTFTSSMPLNRRVVEPPTFSSKAIVTKPAPPWKATAIVNGHVTRLELNDYKGRYLILFFYPQDFSAVCPTELLALSDRVLDFRALQAEIVACSVDSHLTHLAWARTPRSEGGLGNPKIPLLADPTHSIARDYGVLLPDLGHALRAHFIIDRRGVLRHMQVNDLGVGRSIEELLRITQALQHVDETETGCPADWKPGMPNV